jgi:uncharacterized protein (DUF433 family)
MATSWKNSIVTHPDVLSGKPHIKNTRISVEFLLGRLADGWSYEDVMGSYPALKREDIQAAMAFVSEIYTEESFVAERHALAA